MPIGHFDGLVQERHNSSALAMELRLSWINPLISPSWLWLELLFWWPIFKSSNCNLFEDRAPSVKEVYGCLIIIWFAEIWLPSNLWYKPHQISKLKCFLSRLAVVFAQSIEAKSREWRCSWSSTRQVMLQLHRSHPQFYYLLRWGLC